MNIQNRGRAPLLRTASVALITLFGSVSCSASGESTAPTDKSPETMIRISSYTDPYGQKYGDKAFEITNPDGIKTTGDIYCDKIDLRFQFKVLKNQDVDYIEGVSSATVVLKNDAACEDNFLSDNEAAVAVGDLSEGLEY